MNGTPIFILLVAIWVLLLQIFLKLDKVVELLQ